MKNMIIFRDLLLPPSETFIMEQAGRLQNFKPFFVGTKETKGISLSKHSKHIVDNGTGIGKVQRLGLKLFGADLGITQELKKFHPCLIHAHFGPDGLTALPMAKRLKIPLIVTFHGYDATITDEFAKKSSSFSFRRYARRKQALQRSGTYFIAVSDFIKDRIINAGYEPSKILQHYIGVDTGKFTPDPRINRAPVVLFVGRLIERKGCSYLIKAMLEVQNELPEVELVVIGDGPMRTILEQEAKMKLKKYQFLGFLPPIKIKEWMNKSKIFCVPSIVEESGEAEGFGMVFAEANAMGLPVVSFATGGIPEAVADEQTGLLATEKDVDGLICNILRLLKDEEIWKNYSAQGISRVRRLFDLKTQTQKLENIYSMAIDNC